MPVVVSPPPPTPVEPVTEVLHGVPVTDPYRWLEDQNSPRTRKWLEEQNAYTRGYLDAIRGRDRIRKRVAELLTIEATSEPWKAVNRYFYLKRASSREQPVIMMREGDTGEEIALVDPADRHGSAFAAVRILAVSEKGELIAYRVYSGGGLFHTTEFLDVNKKETLQDRLPLGLCCGLVFSSDLRGFFYSNEVVGCSRPHHRAVYWHEFGTNPNSDVEIFFGGEAAHLHLQLMGSPDGRFLGYLIVQADDPRSYAFYVQDTFGRKPPHRIAEQTCSVFSPAFVGSHVLALTDSDAPNLRIIGFDLDDVGNPRWVDIVSESSHRINSFCAVENLLYVARVENNASQIQVYDLEGNESGNVPCRQDATIHLLSRSGEVSPVLYEVSSFDQPPTVLSFQPGIGKQWAWAQARLPFDCDSIQTERRRYRSNDGVEIPISLVFRKGKRRSQPMPVFLTAYGGFGSTRTPRFNTYSSFLIERGFLYAFANVRGGGEFGAEWHSAAKRHRRQTAFDDFISAAEWLIKEGYTIPEKIAIGGMSNGGLVVGAALTQRPDLFRAVVCVGPLLDMLRYHLFDCAHYFIPEYGSSMKSEDFAHLFAYSPYHRISNGVSYPAVLLVSGDMDMTCNPMHARKMTARLQTATGSGRPILLDYQKSWGHFPRQPLSRRVEALTDRLAFICHEVGVDV